MINNIKYYKSQLKAFFHMYDPSNFALFYTIKAAIALLICITSAYFIFDSKVIIFCFFACIFIFYMNTFNAKNTKKIIILSIFAITSSLCALAIPFLINIKLYIFIPCFIWVFIVNFIAAFDTDLQKIGSYVTLLIMVMMISASLNTFYPMQSALAILYGSTIAIIFRTFTLYTYGSYTRRSFLMLLNNLIFMSKNITNNNYNHWQSIFVSRVEEIKKLFASKSANIKDTSLIKNQEMAVFYLLKCEEIAFTLLSLRLHFRKNQHNKIISNIQEEIIFNLGELKNIFLDKAVNLKTINFIRLKDLNTFPILCECLEILYYKFNMFKLGGMKKLDFKENTIKINFKGLKDNFNLKNKYFRFSFKLALATSFSMFLAIFFKIDHGIWIAMGVFTLFKESINSTAIINKNTIYASSLGFALGFLLIFLLPSNKYIIQIILVISYFACIYFKHFPYFLSTILLMFNLVIFFAYLGLDFKMLILFRLTDFIIAFIIVYIFSYIWPIKSENDIKPTIKESTENIKFFLTSIVNRNKYFEAENKVLLSIKKLKDLLDESKHSNFLILEEIIEINNLCINLNDYIYSKNSKVDLKLDSDIKILITRFEMLNKASDNLPFYFYKEVSDKFLSTDNKIKYFLEQIGKRQDNLYKFLISKNN